MEKSNLRFCYCLFHLLQGQSVDKQIQISFIQFLIYRLFSTIIVPRKLKSSLIFILLIFCIDYYECYRRNYIVSIVNVDEIWKYLWMFKVTCHIMNLVFILFVDGFGFCLVD
eukprot:TRINITY_DN2960_c1_g2_i8.p3 TRINITY_DN2960_c1_g2~~TRINITY_DN2960_c1_g2_i8.p3  ORF type:complete len:112 (+),score=1.64 TRINITY_DN2960_c1_g2_i8:63-398(+)